VTDQNATSVVSLRRVGIEIPEQIHFSKFLAERHGLHRNHTVLG
jgi:hypothetical protein